MLAYAYLGSLGAQATAVLLVLAYFRWSNARSRAPIRASQVLGAADASRADKYHAQQAARVATRLAALKRLTEPSTDANPAPRFFLGERVRPARYPEQGCGRIDVMYADYETMLDHFTIPPDWYEMQDVQPLTQKSECWYGVVLEQGGAVLVGARDIERVE